jgi:hypothetical protein
MRHRIGVFGLAHALNIPSGFSLSFLVKQMPALVGILMLLLLGGMLPCRASAQRYLSVENPHKFKRVQIWPGDTLVLKLKGEKVWFGGILEDVHENSIIFSGDSVLLSDVTAVMVARNGTLRHWIGEGRFLATLLKAPIPLAFTANRIILEVKPILTLRNVAISATGFLLGAILKPMSGKRYKLKGNWDLVGRETAF